MLKTALASADEVVEACRSTGVRLRYAENWVYAPAIQKGCRLLTAS
jgi:predicted dehydrogenase